MKQNKIQFIDALTQAPFTDLQLLNISKNSIQNYFNLLNIPFKNILLLYIDFSQNIKMNSLGINSHFKNIFNKVIIKIEN